MTLLLRLQAYPPADLTHLPGFAPPPSHAENLPRISCLLHVGALPSGHVLEVRVRDAVLTGQREDEHLVFSWQCTAGEAIRLTLWQCGRPRREWLGCWNGAQALLHAGSLPVQVLFAGVPQPEVDPVEVVPHLTPSSHNGHSDAEPPDDLVLLARPTPTAENALEASPLDAGTSEPAEQASGQTEASGTALESSKPETMERTPGAPVTPDAEEGMGVAALSASVALPLQAPAGTQLATWQAALESGGSAFQELSARLAQMPAKTLLVDLRQHPRRAGRGNAHDLLSKQALRLTFGARYFDRGWAIRTTQRPRPEPASAGLHHVVTNPHDAEGLPLLVDRLCRGYSLLLFDRTALYEESVRAAVVTELQRQVGNLTMGTLS